MFKTILVLTLVSFAAQPLQGMSKSRTISYNIPSQTQQPINQEKLMLGGALAAGTALAYWLYRRSYNSSLREAHESLDCATKQLAEARETSDRFAKGEYLFAQSREMAAPLYRKIERDKQAIAELVRETRKHRDAWKGYRDYRAADAENLITQADLVEKAIIKLTIDLDHHVAQFVLSESSINTIAEISMRYNTQYNPTVAITTLEHARSYQTQLNQDRSIVLTFIGDLQTYIKNWAQHAAYKNEKVQYGLTTAQMILQRIDTTQTSLTPLLAEFELQQLYQNTTTQFNMQLGLFNNPNGLEEEIRGKLHKETYPLLASVAIASKALSDLKAGAKNVLASNPIQQDVTVLSLQLEMLIKIVANMPAYDEQKKNKQSADNAVADRQQKERLAREAQEAADGRAREERKSRERIARQDREAKERNDQAIAENQRRIARAAEQEAIAAREKAAAEDRKARAEEERVRIERERLRLDQMLAAREKLAGKPKVSSQSQDDNLL